MKSILPRLLFVHDRGQMCNNILQFGHIYAWARENNVRAISTRFAYKYQYYHICHTRWHNFAVYALAKIAVKLHILPLVDFDINKQPDEVGMDKLLHAHRWAWVDGWSVHFHDLFAKYINEICELFTFLPEVEVKAQNSMMPWLTRDNCLLLGVHIRRGDYARFMGGRYYYDDQTMINFIKQFCQLFPEQKIVVFVCSNDPRLNQSFYEQEIPEASFVFPHGTPGEDLCVLSHCNYLIGVPSSFSLVASMYHDARLCFLTHAKHKLAIEDFSTFELLRRRFDTYFQDSPQ